jgi:hypothetical protein
MRKIHFYFLFLGFFLFTNFSYAKDLQDLGLEVNSFSQLEEKRTIFFKESKFFNPEKNFNDKDINDKIININYTSNDPNVIYQFCCSSNDGASVFVVAKLNDASNKLTNLSDKQVFELDNTSQPIKLAIFKKTKLDQFVYFTDNNELILISSDDKSEIFQYLVSKKIIQKKYSLRSLENDFDSPKFKQEPWGDGVITLQKDAISISTLNLTVIQSVVSTEDFGIIVENKSGNRKVVIANKNLQKVFYYGMWDGQRDLDQADQFLKKPVLNIIPPDYSNMFKSGKTILSEKKPNYNFQDINNAIKKIETLNQELLLDLKNKEEKFNQIVNAKLEEQDQKKKAEELKAEQKRLALERQEIEKREQARLETERKNRAAFEKELAAKERMQYIKYGAFVILAILAFIAIIYFKIFDVLNKVLKNIIPKKKRFSYLDVDQKGKKETNQKKQLGIWWADWANSFEKPLSATLIVTTSYIVSVITTSKILQITELDKNNTIFAIAFILFAIPLFYLYKLWIGIFSYHCPKCKRIHAGEVYSSTHIGSQQRAKKYRVQDNRTLSYKDHRGITKKDNYTIERDETGVEQIDTYHNKAKCKLCAHKWEYNTSTATRVR